MRTARSSRRSARSRRRQPARRAQRARRGVLLLVVLSLLVLFLMLGTAFIVSAKQEQQASKAIAKASTKAAAYDSESELLDEVLSQIVRDTKNTASTLRSHSLLGDMYGNDGVFAVIAPDTCSWAGTNYVNVSGASVDQKASSRPGTLSGGQMIEFQIDPTNPAAVTNLFGAQTPLAARDNAYVGQVVTFLSGEAEGASTRIVSYLPPAPNANPPRQNALFTVMAFQLPDGRALSQVTNWSNAFNGARVLINGRPFNGTGVGLDPTLPASHTGARLIAQEAVAPGVNFPLALLPNAAFFNSAGVANPVVDRAGNPLPSYFPPFAAGASPDLAGRGGADESYDVADFQNMILAAIDDPGGNNAVLREATNNSTLNNMVLPSLHRPALLNYWANHASFAPGTAGDLSTSPFVDPTNVGAATMLRKIMLRPSWFDHPNFTGSNPEFEAAINVNNNVSNPLARMIYGPWDVDNDNDGVRDSVWVDFGAPVLQGPDGKRYKPLAAVLVLDMDGRANVNAAGSIDLAKAARNNGGDNVGNVPVVGNNVASMPRGMGHGPVDYSLAAVIGNDDFEPLLVGRDGLLGRYGHDEAAPNNRRAGLANYTDPLAQITHYGWPGNPRTYGGSMTGHFGSMPDLSARFGVGVNAWGQPMWQAATAWTAGDVSLTSMFQDSPYELDLTANGSRGGAESAADACYSLAELERVLRLYDADGATLPRRLAELAGVQKQLGGGDRSDRLRLTTDSYDVPVPGVALPKNLRTLTADPAMAANQGLSTVPRSPVDLFEIRVRNALGAATNQNQRWPYPLDENNDSGGALRRQIRLVLRQIVAPEVLAGGKLNVNRPLGNGVDDNNPGEVGYGVVDEPTEFNRGVWRSANLAKATAANTPASRAVQDEAVRSALVAFENVPFAVAMDYALNAGNIVTVPADARHLLARHLYVTALNAAAPANYGGTSQTDQDLARRLAQWAVNVVDFRDPDNIMTPFEYDTNPFDGWDVNGFIDEVGPDMVRGTGDDLGSVVDDNQNFRGLVWGAERPELLMTEVAAWHDYRTQAFPGRNAQTDASGRSYDPDEGDGEAQQQREEQSQDASLDQVKRPRGALFIELYNPWPGDAGASADTHVVQGRRMGGEDVLVDYGVNLAGRAGDGSPVWRMLIYQEEAFGDAQDPTRDAQDTRLGVLRDPDHPNPRYRPAGRTNRPADRSVYFIDTDPATLPAWDPASDADDGVAFFHDSGAGQVGTVRPGRYAVVGAGRDGGNGVYRANIGSDPNPQDANRDPDLNAKGVVLRVGNAANSVALVNRNGAAIGNLGEPGQYPAFTVESPPGVQANQIPGDRRASQADAVVINRVLGATGNPVERRLTISEPAQGYPNQFGNALWLASEGVEGAYVDNQNQENKMGIDVPLDYPAARANRDDETRLVDGSGQPVYGTLPNYSGIYLQRLANPLLPYDRVANPYLTVDASAANLTTFNGLQDANASYPGVQEAVEARTELSGRPGQRNRFASIERGLPGSARDPADWNGLPQDQRQMLRKSLFLTAPTVGVDRFGTMELTPRADNQFRGNPDMTLGFVNRAHMDMNRAGDDLKQTPAEPYQWLAWQNRPYISANELLTVPARRSSQLLREITGASTAQTPDPSPYEETQTTEAFRTRGRQQRNPLSLQFVQLENFFYDDDTTSTEEPAGLYAMLDMIGVPSLFAGTTEWLNPRVFTTDTQQGGVPVNNTPVGDVRAGLQAPYNNLPPLREPGKINLNTISSEDVYGGLFHGRDVAPAWQPNSQRFPGPYWNRVGGGRASASFVASRRGYGSSQQPFLLQNNVPTFFANPFRAAGTGDMVPLDNMVVANIDATLLRSDQGTGGTNAEARGTPLFAATTNGAGTQGQDPLDARDAIQNAYFRYEPLVRLDNMTTTRSNVYAVWITIGFFEVEEFNPLGGNDAAIYQRFGASTLAEVKADPNAWALFQRVYPNSVKLGKEIGLDTGEVRRMRGFYMIDRSLPAAFEPGADHNVENVIQLRRRIQ